MRFVWTTAILWAMWCLLSGKFDALHLGGGLVSAALAAAACRRWHKPQPLPVLRLIAYVPWLLWEVIKSNLHVARLVLAPKLGIKPRFLEINPQLQSDRAITLLGCSITLTPGTVTVEADHDHLIIHALDGFSAEGPESGETARRVRAVFGEEKQEVRP